MTSSVSTGPTFKEQELAGWTAKAADYGDYFGAVTRQIVAPLLDAACVHAGSELLDIACGPGYTIEAALERGANGVGVDFARTMVAEAQRRVPGAEFCEGDAEHLRFEAGRFDAVTCGFGVGHFAQPERAMAEAFRVLRAGGRYAFSWWCSNDKHEFFGLIHSSIVAHGNVDVPLPPAPPFARFSEPEECRRTLSATGFSDVRATKVVLHYDLPTPQDVIDSVERAGVRTAMVLALQTKEARAKIDRAILEAASRFKHGDGLRFKFPAIVASGSKP